jgi:hypothetical protein
VSLGDRAAVTPRADRLKEFKLAQLLSGETNDPKVTIFGYRERIDKELGAAGAARQFRDGSSGGKFQRVPAFGAIHLHEQLQR